MRCPHGESTATTERSDRTELGYRRCRCRHCRHIFLVDVQLSDTQDLTAVEAFLRSAWTVTSVIPDRITTHGHDAYPCAIRNVFGDRVTQRTNRYLNNHLEQDHRGIKQRYRPMYGLKTFDNAVRFCRLFDEIRAFLLPLYRRNQPLSLVQRRDIHRERFAQLMGMIAAASPQSPQLTNVL